MKAFSMRVLQSPIIIVDSPSTWSCCLMSKGSLPSAFILSSLAPSVSTSWRYIASSFLTRDMIPVLILSARSDSLLSVILRARRRDETSAATSSAPTCAAGDHPTATVEEH